MLVQELTPEEKLLKATIEGNYWFKEARDQYNRAEHLASVIRKLREEMDVKAAAIDELAEKEASDAERFELITAFWHAARRTGYDTSWSIGGITIEKLREELEKAENYTPPKKANAALPAMLHVGTAKINDGAVVLDSYRVTGARPAGMQFKNLYITKD